MDPVKLFTVIVLISLPTVMFGGYALLDLLSKEKLTEFQRTYFRAGHAHAGVLLVLALVCQLLADAADLTGVWNWLARSGVAAAALLMPGGFFLSSMGRGRSQPNALVAMVFAGAIVLALGLASLGVGLLTAGR